MLADYFYLLFNEESIDLRKIKVSKLIQSTQYKLDNFSYTKAIYDRMGQNNTLDLLVENIKHAINSKTKLDNLTRNGLIIISSK